MFTSGIYSSYPSFVLGFHGCEKEIGEKILTGETSHLNRSENTYDWLGHGIYFWENSPSRAEEFAKSKRNISNPFIIGAVIDLGKCLDFLDYENLQLLKDSYVDLKEKMEEAELPLPKNKFPKNSSERLIRYLDCSVIENLHDLSEEQTSTSFDSVRGVFVEGEPIYETAGFHNKNHIQLCIRNLDCIKGYFRPL